MTVSLVLKENENGNSILSKVNNGSLSKFVNRDVISNKNSDSIFLNQFETYIVDGYKVANINKEYSIKLNNRNKKIDWVICNFNKNDKRNSDKISRMMRYLIYIVLHILFNTVIEYKELSNNE